MVTIQLKVASGGPAGGQTFACFQKDGFDKQVLKEVACPTDVGKPYGSGLTSMQLPFLSAPAGAEKKGSCNRKVFAELFSKSDPPEAY